jgi:hypothetical protein
MSIRQQIKDWDVTLIVDEDGHLNVYVLNNNSEEVTEIETGQGDGVDGEQLALRFTTPKIEADHRETN